ncbi:hypothetical protein [Polyangium jinanense]|uniref:Uncharacterized protein n=1 Tax=Polyangium jinanense TaxID=2829994 RepID=A0A9X3X6V9_9BACT|nr:hypothetical protein [Polyangium jinanense]MDC3958101.1 hypothetical protein [Polyangium jinanense]MDC3983700.1 hypothetical protein [Polyangium jinanense]
MNFLEPDTDRVVRVSIDAFLEGRLRPDVSGDRVFETKNSRYRLKAGKLVAATSSQLVGSELVGWLVDEESDKARVLPRWSPGARAVLLVKRLGRHIVVTSATLMMEVDGVLVEGSDTRPLSPGKVSTPAMLAVTPPSAQVPMIPKAAAMPSGVGMAIPLPDLTAADAPASAPRAPINPSTPPPGPGPASGQVVPSTPTPPGRTSLG